MATRIAIWLVGGFLLMQLVPYGRDKSNPVTTLEPAWDAPETRALFMRACGDCHSGETRWPWYSHVAPASWLLQYDVHEGREHFDVSHWDRKEQEGDDAAKMLRKEEMPPWFYLPLHPEARLAGAEREQLLGGLVRTFGDEDQDHDSGSGHHDD